MDPNQTSLRRIPRSGQVGNRYKNNMSNHRKSKQHHAELDKTSRDNEKCHYNEDDLSWKLPIDVFQKIIEQFPDLKSVNYEDWQSRWHFMKQVQESYWFYIENLPEQFPDLPIESNIDESVYFSSLIYSLVLNVGLKAYYKPSRYHAEWSLWQKNCPVAGIMLVRQHPKTKKWETLLVKNNNRHFVELVYSWPCGKVELSDKTYWELATREVREEIGIDFTDDRSNVIAVLSNSRAVDFVLPIAYDDSRLNKIVLQKKELESFAWLPINLPPHKIHLPSKVSTQNSNMQQNENKDAIREGVVVKESVVGKQSPPTRVNEDVYMAYLEKQAFPKLKKFIPFETRQDDVEEWLNKDPIQDMLARNQSMM